MVQIINMPAKRSIGQAIGEGIGAGFNQGISTALEEHSYGKKLGMQAKYQDMLEAQKQRRDDVNVWKAAEGAATYVGAPEMQGFFAAGQKVDKNFISNFLKNTTQEEKDQAKLHFMDHAAGGGQGQPPLAQTGGSEGKGQSAIQSGNINPQTNATNAQKQATMAPNNPLVLQDRQGQMTQPRANMMPPNAVPTTTAPQTASDEDRFIDIGGVKRVKSLDLAQTPEERRTFWERTSKTPAEARAKEHAWTELEKLKETKKRSRDSSKKTNKLKMMNTNILL